MNKLKLWSLLLLCLVISGSCKKDTPSQPDPVPSIQIIQEKITLNPSNYNPLSASIEIELDKEVSIHLSVAGQNGMNSDLKHAFGELNFIHTVPVLGLYPDTINKVTLTFLDSSGKQVGSKTFDIQTGPLLEDLPEIDIDVAYSGPKRDDFTLVSYFGYSIKMIPQRVFMFDQFGSIRWYLDYKPHPVLKDLFYDVGVEQLENGNFYFGDGETNKIYEVDAMGSIVNSWELTGFEHHHHVFEKPNGNFLVTVNKKGLLTLEDHIVEIDRQTRNIINVWDLRQSLDSDRQALTSNRSDWIHVNSVVYDESDNTIIISGRTQGVVKLTQDNEVVWILGNHSGWGVSGNGVDLNTKLLTPLDSDNQKITDIDVLSGSKNHPDFEWNWYQHAAKRMPNGNILLFDNGEARNFSNDLVYSRAVEYEIDEENRTVKEIWSYGKERGKDTYSRIVSDVDFLEASNRIVFSPGAIWSNNFELGKVIEVDYNSKQVLFEASIRPPTSFYTITFHRTERVSLY